MNRDLGMFLKMCVGWLDDGKRYEKVLVAFV